MHVILIASRHYMTDITEKNHMQIIFVDSWWREGAKSLVIDSKDHME